MKNLNRIQSIVCDTAYRTNENMLVCAPTGAGLMKILFPLSCFFNKLTNSMLNRILKFSKVTKSLG